MERLGRIRDQLKEWRQQFESRYDRPASKPDIANTPAVGTSSSLSLLSLLRFSLLLTSCSAPQPLASKNTNA